MIYLVVTRAGPERIREIDGVDDVHEFCEGVIGVDAAATRSQLYHRLKDHQAGTAPLLVAPLERAPKLKRMAPGSIAWLRRRFEAGTASV